MNVSETTGNTPTKNAIFKLCKSLGADGMCGTMARSHQTIL
jgi:hypothetical protein